MRKTIISRLLLVSFVMICIGLFAVQFFVRDFLWNYLVEEEASIRYRQANLLATQYSSQEYANLFRQYPITLKMPDESDTSSEAVAIRAVLQQISKRENEIHQTLTEASDFMDAYAGIVNSDGRLIVASMPGPLQLVISSFDMESFGSSYYMITTLPQSDNIEVLTAMYPINFNYQVVAYMIVFESTDVIYGKFHGVMNNIYISFGIVFSLYILILVFFLARALLPVRSLTMAAREYAKGNFTYRGLKDRKFVREYQALVDSLNFMADRINDMDEYQKKFISNISHDFRTPLTSIKGYAEAIADGTIPPEMQGRYLGIILTEAERLTKMANSLIELKRWGHTGTQIIRDNFDIMAVIKSTLASFERTCMTKKIRFDLTSFQSEIMVSGDVEKIRQVAYNLIDNALKFSPSEETIFITLTERNEKIFVSIKDNGIGIPRDEITKIWDRFYKSDYSRGRDRTGSGIGLAIVKEIIQAHNEQIDVISTPDVGTEFIFTLSKERH